MANFSPRQLSNPRANVFILVNLGCEMLYVIDQRLKAQQIAQDKSVQVIHDVTSVLLEPKFIDSLLNGSKHNSAQLLTAEHCKFMLNDIATCSLMRLDEQSMSKLWNLMTMVYKWQLFVSRHQHHLLEITFRHLEAINRLYPDAKRHMLIDFTKNTLLDFWNASGEDAQLSIYQTNRAWLQCFNTKISLLIRMGFQAMDGSFIRDVDQDYYAEYVESAGDNIYAKSADQRERQQREPNSMDQLAAQLNINPAQSEDLQPINARQFQQQFEQAFGNVLFNDTAASSSGCEFVQLQPTTSASSSEKVATSMSRGGSLLNQNLLDLYSKMP
uniref:Organic solute carrier partner 1 n=2 Tax=Drosophila melanogaster TaxID=7227 RepID=A1Z8T6_DROME|nr:organic solute carrier partner 1 [Drosophila melanogaster]AAF58577.2 organic solute carrier partner 1 [Drosophila melanogaster]